MRHTVVLSDLHLSEVEPGRGAWMRHRQAPFQPDRDVGRVLEGVRASMREGDDLAVVLAGDVFDLDAPRVLGGRSVFHDLPRSARHAVPALSAILDDHPAVVAALARVLAEGGRLVILSGNHDAQLTLPEVRDLLRARLVEAAGHEPSAAPNVEDRIAFRAWFHVTPDGILIEHGHQYDPCCAHRYPTAPFGADAGTIEPTLGSLGARLLASRLGTLDPHDDGAHPPTTLAGAGHWARHYLLSRRSPAWIWLSGAARTLAVLRRDRLREGAPERRARRRADVEAAARETGASPRAVARHARLRVQPIGDDLGRVARVLWIDRVALALSALVAVAAVALLAPELVGAVLFFPPLVVAAYSRAAKKPKLADTWRRAALSARHIAKIHGVRAVVLGHTHEASGSWEGGVFIGNSGSWPAALGRGSAASVPRPVVWLRSDDRGLSGGLYAWVAGRFDARAVREG